MRTQLGFLTVFARDKSVTVTARSRGRMQRTDKNAIRASREMARGAYRATALVLQLAHSLLRTACYSLQIAYKAGSYVGSFKITKSRRGRLQSGWGRNTVKHCTFLHL